jgi:CHAT domain-containing protein
LGELVVYLRKAIQIGDEKNARRYLQNLHQILIQPLLDQGVRLEAFDRVAIIPHAVLHYVPFAALLHDKGTYLISKTAVTVVPSASVWFLLSQRSGPAQRFVGFGNPNLRGLGAAELKYAAQEMADIPKLLTAARSAVFVGPDATEDGFVKEAPSANILHISTHGEFPDEDAIRPSRNPACKRAK